MRFGDRLRAARKHAKLTQKALASASGVSQSVISEAENGDYDGSRFVVQLAAVCGVDPEWLSSGKGEMLAQSRVVQEPDGPYKPSVRVVPVLNTVQAGNPKQVVDDFAPGAAHRYIELDPTLAEECGPHTFALEVAGDSMADQFQPGDVVVVDPGSPYGPGDIVIAKLDRDDEATMKKYRDRGVDDDGRPMFELVPINEDYSKIVVNAQNPGIIIGPVIEHRRRLRRRTNGR